MGRSRRLVCVAVVVAVVVGFPGCGSGDGQPPRGSIVTPPRDGAGDVPKGAEKSAGKGVVKPTGKKGTTGP